MYFKKIFSLIICFLLSSQTTLSMHQNKEKTKSNTLNSVYNFAKSHYILTSLTVATSGALTYSIYSKNPIKYKTLFKGKFKKNNECEKLPIIYSPSYNISFFGIENLHPFDTKKYGAVVQYLTSNCNIDQESFINPIKAADEQLLLVHTQNYLQSLNSSSTIAAIAEVPPIKWVPNFLLQRFLINPMKLATGGTIEGAKLALKEGWAINLSGGYHHAKSNSGGGFCVFADIPIAIKSIRQENPNLKVFIVDLDAHQGNGHESALKDDKLSYIFDIYNEYIYPNDIEAKKRINFNIPVKSGINDQEYLSLLKKELPNAIEEVKPDLIIYNAGTDIFEKDPLGRMKITSQGIIERDAFVFNQAKNKNIPILMVLSGGYTKDTALIIGKSVENILKNIIKITK